MSLVLTDWVHVRDDVVHRAAELPLSIGAVEICSAGDVEYLGGWIARFIAVNNVHLTPSYVPHQSGPWVPTM